jgi:hypothetical protein
MLNFKHRVIQNPAEGLVTGFAITFASSTVMLQFQPSKPVRIVRWGAVVTTTASDSGSATLVFTGNVWPTAGSSASAVVGSTTTVQSANGYNASNAAVFYVDTAGGSLTVPNAQLNAGGGVVAGSVIWHNVNPQATQTGGYYPAPDTALIPPGGVSTQLVIYPGQSFVINCTGVGSTAGAGKLFLEVEEQPFVADFNNNALVVSGYPSNSTTPTPSLPFAHAAFNYQS